MTPTRRSMIALRAAGYVVAVTERWIPGRNIRVDLFGVGDLLAVRSGERPLMVQVTTAGHVSTRVAKAKAESRLRVWLQSGSGFVVHGWQRVDGKWTCRIVPIVLDDMDNLAALPPPRRRRRPHERSLFDTPESARGDALSAGSSIASGISSNATASADGIYDVQRVIQQRVSKTLDPKNKVTAA
jgi:hypothetical protein